MSVVRVRRSPSTLFRAAKPSSGKPPGKHHRQHDQLALLNRAARTPRGTVGLILTGFVTVVAFAGPLVPVTSSNALVTTPFAKPASGLPLGGEILGRDVLSRVLDGGWLLLLMAVAATALGVSMGATAGTVAAYVGGRWDSLIMRTVDVILAFPHIVFALLLVSVLGPKLWLVVLAVALGHSPQVARVTRAAALDVSERDYVKAIELQGVKGSSIIMHEILPNLTSPLMVETGLRLTYSIVTITGLAFLGFGQPPPASNWGLMINENRIGAVVNLWGVVAPAALIALLTIGVNTFTEHSRGHTWHRSSRLKSSSRLGGRRSGSRRGLRTEPTPRRQPERPGCWYEVQRGGRNIF